jgi:UDP-glucose 4-epimerase
MKVLVIGGCGFIGSHVTDALVARGLQVRVLDRRAEPFRAPLRNVDYVLGNFADTGQLFDALAGIDAVIHLASTTVPASANLDPVSDITGNLIATVRLLEIMRRAGQRRIVYLSSGGTVYGITGTDPVPETHALRPITSYGIVKVAIENYLHMEQALHGLGPVVLRAANPYGPRQGHTGVQGVIGTHLWKIARNEPVEIWGDGSVVRDFIHVRDLARLCADVVQSEATGCFNAGSGEGASINGVVAAINRAVTASGGAPVQPVHKPGRAFDVPRIVLDIARARDSFGWSPRIPLDEGLAETWAWIRSQTNDGPRPG